MVRKSCFCLCLALALILFTGVPAAACWEAPEPFEVYSADTGKVFVFIPYEGRLDNAIAAVYKIVDGERQLVYTVEDLASFAYESNFHFSADMMHFARIFPQYGMDTFEVFSYGVRTRVVTRNEFIENYASVDVYTSIGPFYSVRWRIIEDSAQGTVVGVSTCEYDGLLFDLATARFCFEDVVPIYAEPVYYVAAQPDVAPEPAVPTPAPQVQEASFVRDVTMDGFSIEPVPRALFSPTAIVIIVCAAVVFIAAGVFLLKMRRRPG